MAMMAAAARAVVFGARQQQLEVGAGAKRAGQRRVKKLGQPVPLSNFISDVNSGRSQPAQ